MDWGTLIQIVQGCMWLDRTNTLPIFLFIGHFITHRSNHHPGVHLSSMDQLIIQHSTHIPEVHLSSRDQLIIQHSTHIPEVHLSSRDQLIIQHSTHIPEVHLSSRDQLIIQMSTFQSRGQLLIRYQITLRNVLHYQKVRQCILNDWPCTTATTIQKWSHKNDP